MELMVLLAQTVCVWLLTMWLTTGVRDNILHPSVNEVITAEVLDMTRMRTEFPEAYAQVAHRRIASRKTQIFFFRCAVAWELFATVVLWIGGLAMAASMLGLMGAETGKTFGLAGALMFTTTWAMFLIVGNHLSYWFCHEGAQNTHFQMTLWGIVTMIFLGAA